MTPLYTRPELYAATFAYRDIEGEADFATARAGAALGRPAASACELAAGPALHGRALAAAGLRVAAVEREPAAAAWLAAAAPGLEVVRAELESFALAAPVDLMLAPLSALSYLLDDAAWAAALGCIHAGLTPGGLLVAELAPGDATRAEPDSWSAEGPAGPVEVWAGPSRRVAADVFEWELRLRYAPAGGEAVELSTVERQRAVTAWQVERLLRAAGFVAVRAWAGCDAARRYRGGESLVVEGRRADLPHVAWADSPRP